jgi:hypothetical protein
MARKKSCYSQWIRLDAAGILRLDVQLSDCAVLLQFLRSSNLQFDCAPMESGGEHLSFHPGTSIQHVQTALTQFDQLNNLSL